MVWYTVNFPTVWKITWPFSYISVCLV